MTTLQIVLFSVLSLSVVSAGAYLDIRASERDRAARTTNFSDPNTLHTGRTQQREASEAKTKKQA
ncbi:hypothetical protein [Stutzerimonas azotifigens]|uniref:Secreted protein n=1 Tax=Stutzerimonas azotifigens TaxID=291995 RepID=A0ABR5Z5A8_9GAMM|nr:hypothetical protein [Stutzerimonas azotifigens]MBA1275380.1 hypothetical protein [Stutzerimonas azotifigens]